MEKMGLLPRSVKILVVAALLFSSIGIANYPVLEGASAAVTARTGGNSHNITLFLHNVSDSEASKTIPGSGSTWNWFDTTTDFNEVNTTLTATGTNNRFDWYLYPALADNVTTSSITLKIWAKAGSGSAQNANIQLEIYERDPTGSETQVQSTGLGSVTFPAVGTLWSWTSTFSAQHTFSKGSTIKVRLVANPGTSKTVYFYYDSLAANSRVIIPTSDHIFVKDIQTRDSNGNMTSVYGVTGNNLTADIRALINDPFSGYDIKWVNITITGPRGTVYANKTGMTKISGNPIDLTITYRYLFNYTGLPSGLYNVTIWALDNSGYNHYHHFQQYNYGEYPVTGKSFFYIGGQPKFLWVRVHDDLQMNLSGARVGMMMSSYTASSNQTNSSGLTNITVMPGNYLIRVYWENVVVAEMDYSVTDNVTLDRPLLINASVIYPTLTVVDNASVPIHKAAVYLVHPNGTVMDPLQTDTSGNISLIKVPAGKWGMTVRWRGVVINKSKIDLRSSIQYIVNTTVYYLTVTTRDLSGNLMINIGLSAFENETGLILDFKLTGSSGQAKLRVPKSVLDLEAYWLNLPVNRTYNIAVTGDMSITMICDIYNVPVVVTDPHGSPVVNAVVVFWTYPGGDLLGTGRTDDQGATSMKLVDGRYSVEVTWMDAVVNTSLVTIIGGRQVNIIADIFYINLTAYDTAGDTVGEVDIITYSSADTVISAETLDSNGNGVLRLPLGQVRLTMFWKGVLVYDSNIDVTADSDLDLTIAVHQITFNVVDSHSMPLPTTTVNLYLNSTGELISTGVTNYSGSVTLRTATTLVDLTIFWKDVRVHSMDALSFLDSGYWNVTVDVYYIEFQVYDANSASVPNALVKLTIAGNGNVLGSNTTDDQGTVTIRLPAASVDIEVFWKNFLVYFESGYDVSGDATKIIQAMIYYITFRAIDSLDIPVAEASIDIFYDGDPSPITSGITDDSGLVQVKVPIGIFFVETRWLDVLVNTTTVDISRNIGDHVLHLSIYYIDFHVVDSRDIAVSGAVIYVERNGTGRLLGSGITSVAGRATLRLPGTSTDITVYWDEVLVYDEREYLVYTNEEKTLNSWIYYLDLEAVDEMGDPVGDCKIYFSTQENLVKYKDTTAQDGTVTFRLPLDDYYIEVFWKNILVYTGDISISSDRTETIVLNIFHVTFEALDSRDAPVFSAQVNVFNNRTGDLINSGITDLEGKVTLRVAGISVDANAYYRGILIYSEYDHIVSENELWVLNTDMFYVAFKAIDSRDVPLFDATISVISEFTGETLDFGRTNPQGLATLRIPKTSVNVKAEWLGLNVYNDLIEITGDREMTNPVILHCTVYYVDVEILDEKDIPAKDAVVTVISNGLIIESVTTDENGLEVLRVPGGTYQLYVAWNGVQVYFQQVNVAGDGNWSFNVNIFYLEIQVLDADDIAVLDASVSIVNVDYPSIGSSDNTDANGTSVFRLPIGSYNIAVMWKDRLTSETDGYQLDSSKKLTISAQIYYLTVDIVDDRDMPLENAFVTVFHLEHNEVYDAKVSGSTGSIRVRMPVGIYNIEVVWRQKLVSREENIVIDENRGLTIDAEVHYLTVTVISGKGDPIENVEVQVYDEAGLITDGMLTDDNGTAEFRLPADDYTIELFLKRTHLFKRIDMNKTKYTTLNSSQAMEVKFNGYPPSFFTTPLFYASLLPIFLLLLIFAAAVFLYFKRPWEKMETGSEVDEPDGKDRKPKRSAEGQRDQDRPQRRKEEKDDDETGDEDEVPKIDKLFS